MQFSCPMHRFLHQIITDDQFLIWLFSYIWIFIDNNWHYETIKHMHKQIDFDFINIMFLNVELTLCYIRFHWKLDTWLHILFWILQIFKKFLGEWQDSPEALSHISFSATIFLRLVFRYNYFLCIRLHQHINMK